MKRTQQILKYVLTDLISASLAWMCFYAFRRLYIEPRSLGYHIPLEAETKLILGMLIIPVFWVLVYYLSGYYRDIFRKSRLKDIGQTFIQSMGGIIFLFFILILDDVIETHRDYYRLFAVYLTLHFTFTVIPRFIFTSVSVFKIKKGQIAFNTLIIGNSKKSLHFCAELQNHSKITGNRLTGFVFTQPQDHYPDGGPVPVLGNLDDIKDILGKNNIREVIIALEPGEQHLMGDILNRLAAYDIIIKAIPGMNDILLGKVKMPDIFSAPLIQVSHDLMPVWQENVKQLSDIVISVLVLVLLSPVILILSVGIKLSSRGPVIHSQERAGRFGKAFRIYKFRSMYADAEKNGPELASRGDYRLTKIGRFMRKFRLDEIPNFINVLKGEMSVVGPRPERKFYIDQIIKKAPYYVHLHKVKPGITSLGQVKFGYAENIDQMIQRLQFDLLYIQNMSLFMDFRIMLYTVLTILRGKGV